MRNSFVMIVALISALLFAGLQSSDSNDQSRGKGKQIRGFALISLGYRDAVKRIKEDEQAFRQEWFMKEDLSHPLPPSAKEQDIVSFHSDISYGDLTGDGNEEASVEYHYHVGEGSSVNFSGVLVYALRDGRPESIAHVNGGDLAYGGIKSAVICGCLVPDLEHRLVVERYRPSEKGCHSCYGYIEKTVYKLEGNKLLDVERKVRMIPPAELENRSETSNP